MRAILTFLEDLSGAKLFNRMCYWCRMMAGWSGTCPCVPQLRCDLLSLCVWLSPRSAGSTASTQWKATCVELDVPPPPQPLLWLKCEMAV